MVPFETKPYRIVLARNFGLYFSTSIKFRIRLWPGELERDQARRLVSVFFMPPFSQALQRQIILRRRIGEISHVVHIGLDRRRFPGAPEVRLYAEVLAA